MQVALLPQRALSMLRVSVFSFKGTIHGAKFSVISYFRFRFTAAYK